MRSRGGQQALLFVVCQYVCVVLTVLQMDSSRYTLPSTCVSHLTHTIFQLCFVLEHVAVTVADKLLTRASVVRYDTIRYDTVD